MHITSLRIRHFRNFMASRFQFREGVNTLIGENGSGKSNALHVLRLLLDETLPRNATHLRESDFCRDLGQWRGHWIIASADIADLDPSEGCQLLRHSAGHMDRSNTGTVTFFFRPKGAVRKKLHDLSEQGNGVGEYINTLTIDDYEPLLTGRACGDFLDDQVYNRCAGNPEVGTFPDPDEDDLEVLGVRVQPIHREVACTFVRALRDVISELRTYRDNPLLTLLRGMESSIEIADAQRITGKVADLNRDISSLAEIQGLASGIESALRKAVGQTYAPGITIESALPDSMERILQRLGVLVGDSATSAYRGELHEQSLGGANLIYLALKLLEYETKLSGDRVAHFLLIEEPEAHIHTHIQKALFASLPSTKTQVIVSTHSTHISSASKIDSVNVLAKKGSRAEVYQPAHGLTPETVRRVERYLDETRSTLLFAKGVLLVEGDAEQIMIPAMLRAVFGVSPDELGFSVISMGCAFFEHISIVFAEDRIRRPCAIVTDLDSALVSLPENPDHDNEAQAHARKAERLGRIRHRDLQRLAAKNYWTQAFFATHTFEVDFIEAGNSFEVIETLDDIYTQKATKDGSEERLKSDDLQVSGAEMLRLAEKIGKGWLALLISEKLTHQTFIPDYILRAVAFACHLSLEESTLKQVAAFRANAFGYSSQLHNISTFGLLSTFRSKRPDDELSRLWGHLEALQGDDPS